MIQEIFNDKIRVQVNLKGGELWSIKDMDGTEYLWQGDARYWSDKAIHIFPYIARLNNKTYTFHGNAYQMDIHGFVKDSFFEVLEKTETTLTIGIKDTLETYVQYPWHFQFIIAYCLEGSTLSVQYVVKNNDNKKMYFAVGGHPGFNLPMEEGLQFEDYELVFDEKAEARRIRFSPDCFVQEGTDAFAMEEGVRIPMAHNLFDQDAIVLEQTAKTVTLQSAKGKKAIRVHYPQMDYIGFWHCPKTEAPYVCIEPWSSLPSREGIVEEFENQENLLQLEADGEYKNLWTIEVLNCEVSL